jgi:hypothetical protein
MRFSGFYARLRDTQLDTPRSQNKPNITRSGVFRSGVTGLDETGDRCVFYLI